MYLKSIEIQGFKSFANKIVFQFHNGITGIVGPNGSGKSNVADAVRWVLGEQRIRQLRGASMQDVIFSGTEMRKPLSYAYVAITLDNGDRQLAIDYDEVTVARRIYRSGESEYLINGSAVRLRDVNEMFYDTGIGKEGYSIIGQGQIDKILSGKPEDRRELFDEAAGIVKFKRRKAAAGVKLDNERQNMVRVKDILTELEKQIGPLERQSEVAKVYLRKKEELKTLDINVFLLENRRLQEQLSSLEEKYATVDAQLRETNGKYESIKEEYERVQTQVEGLDAGIVELRNHLTDTGLTQGRLEGEVNVLKEQINSARGSEAHLLNRQDKVKSDIEERKREEERILSQKGQIDLQLQDVLSARERLQERLVGVQERISRLSQGIEDGKNAIIEELNKRAAIKSQMGRFDSIQEQVGIRRAELNSRLLRAKSDEAERTESLKRLEEEFETITARLTELRNKETRTEEALGKFREELTQSDAGLQETQSRYHQESSRLEALVNLTERYEGYGGSVKKVMECKSREKGIIGVVADILKTDPKYETAIETALGGSIQNIVTDGEETAKKMIQYLKKERLGRATFLPLTSLTHTQEFRNDKALREEGVIGLADSLVRVEERYRVVARSLLGRILVVDNMDRAVRIARKYDYNLRMVTLEGELLVPGGAISGGAYKNSSNLLGRRREIEELERRVKELRSQVNTINTEISIIKARRNQTRVDLEAIKTQLQNKSIEQNTARLNIIQARERMEEEEASYHGLQKEQAQLEQQIQEIQSGREGISQALAESEASERGTNEKIAALQTSLDEERAIEAQVSSQAREWEVKAETMQQSEQFHQTNVDRINGELERLTGELAEIEEALKDNALQVTQKQADIARMEETIRASRQTQVQSEARLKEELARREELAAKQKNFFQSREELAEQKSILDKEAFRLNAQKERLEEAMESQINYMWQEYEITLTDACALRREDLTDLNAMKKESASLKDQIKKLGNVNVNAIEEYRDLMERYTLMKTQHDDLVEAEKTLEGIIQELDSAMRRQFTEKFALICQEFDKVFKELFGGGKGTLELQEDEDLLEAGIRIIAQPPGKKLQNMMQLSGGEKALTAIALLFAIQNLKPSPFCLLDEIEAALDESNVGRFAKYLHKLTKNTQFIVITHRRGTMERVDRLYGITMQEKGVSALVSVNLIDKDLDD